MDKQELENFYSWQSNIYNFTRQFTLFSRQHAIDALKIKSSDTVIDLACGTGLNIPKIKECTKPENIVGVDYSKSMLSVAKDNHPEVTFIRGDVSEHDFDFMADKVISTYSMSMIEDWQETVVNVKNTLKPGGRFVILDFHPWNWPIKPAYPLFRRILNRHGVDPEKPITEFMREHFSKVNQDVRNFGYNQVITADKVAN